VATRGGIVSVRSSADGDIEVQMGLPQVLADRPVATAAPLEPRTALAAVRMPNPHVVVPVSADELATLDLTTAPRIEPALPDGQNVEFVATLGPQHLRMRVFERGVGETRSCGTGICAAVVAAAGEPDGATWRVDVPGGSCRVVWHTDGTIELIGPAVIVAELDLDDDWVRGYAGT
jgi:diaminopimelate epimerase